MHQIPAMPAQALLWLNSATRDVLNNSASLNRSELA